MKYFVIMDDVAGNTRINQFESQQDTEDFIGRRLTEYWELQQVICGQCMAVEENKQITVKIRG